MAALGGAALSRATSADWWSSWIIQPVHPARDTLEYRELLAMANTTASSSQPAGGLPSAYSLWSFLNSNYAIGLLVVGIVVHRIEHVCRPTRRPAALSMWRRTLLRTPAILALVHVTFRLLRQTLSQWQALRLQDGNIASQVIRQWDQSQSDASLFWNVFLATCLGLVTDELVKELEATSSEGPTFNLLYFALLLYFHLHPSKNPTRVNRSSRSETYTNTPLAPLQDERFNVLLCVLLSVSQLAVLSITNCWRNFPVPRLVLTGAFGLVKISHYLIALPTGAYPFIATFNRAPETAVLSLIVLTVSLHAITQLVLASRITFSTLIFHPSNLPSLDQDYGVALVHLATACLASTHATGLSREMVELEVRSETWIELEANGNVRVHEGAVHGPDDHLLPRPTLQGLNQEIKHVRATYSQKRRHSFVYLFHPAHSRLSRALQQLGQELAFIGKLCATALADSARRYLPLHLLPGPPVHWWTVELPRKVRLMWHGRNGERAREQRQQAERRRRERHRQSTQTGNSTQVESVQSGRIGLQDRINWQHLALDDHVDDDYAPSLEQSDDEDDRSDVSSSDHNEAGEDGLSDPDDDEDVDVATLLSLARTEFDSAAHMDAAISSSLVCRPAAGIADGGHFSDIYVAHVASGSSMLTRRGYRAQQVGGEGDMTPAYTLSTSASAAERETLLDVIARRRPPPSSRGSRPGPPADEQEERRAWELDRLRLCVVCCTDPRSVIVWPCRCLALCEGCRAALAGRPDSNRNANAGANTADAGAGDGSDGSGGVCCPTCRGAVVGFSRVFLP